MARLPVPGGDDGTWGDVLNQFLLTSHNADGSLSASALPDGSVTNPKIVDGTISEAKLDGAVQTKLNAVGGGDPVVGGDLSGVASNAQIVAGAVGVTELAAGAITDAKVSASAAIAQSKIANLTSDLANKASTTHTHAIADTTNLQTALDTKADETITVTGATSLTGGGDLTSSRTIALVNDAATPGNSRYYGTDGAGAKGFHALPAGDPTMGGDLTGTASNAQIAAGAVGVTELAADSVTEPKLDAANAPSNGQVLSWNGTNFSWVNQTSSSGYVQGDGIAKITVGTTAPTGPVVGDVWINT